jgi:hypothetical protein
VTFKPVLWNRSGTRTAGTGTVRHSGSECGFGPGYNFLGNIAAPSIEKADNFLLLKNCAKYVWIRNWNRMQKSKDANFFSYFFLITYPQAHYLQS